MIHKHLFIIPLPYLHRYPPAATRNIGSTISRTKRIASSLFTGGRLSALYIYNTIYTIATI